MFSLYSVLWPIIGCVFLLSAIVCLVSKRWVFASGLLLPGILLLGSWRYDRTHESISKWNVALTDKRLVKENREHPEESLFYVSVTALEMGSWEGKLRAADMHLTGPPGTIVTVEIAKRPLTGSYIKSMASMDYGKPPPRYTYVPPPQGGEFQYIFNQPPPPGTTVEHVISDYDEATAKIALAFRTDRVTFERIRPATLEPIPFDFFGLKKLARKEATWWRPATSATEIWGRNATDGKNYVRRKEDHFDTDREVLTWDEDGLVQYLWLGRGVRTDR